MRATIARVHKQNNIVKFMKFLDIFKDKELSLLQKIDANKSALKTLQVILALF